MSDTTDNDDEPTKAELHDRVRKLESTVEKLMPSRRDALKLGAAGIAGAAGLSATSGSADASTGSAGQIGDVNNRPDVFADTVDANSLSGSVKNQGCRVFLSSKQTMSQNTKTKIKFDSEVYDSGNNFDTSTHEWTCPETGVYLVNAQVKFLSGGSGDQRGVAIGSGTTTFPTEEGAFTEFVSTDTQDKLSATSVNKYSSGDTIAAYARNNDSSDQLEKGPEVFETFLEVAFLGGL